MRRNFLTFSLITAALLLIGCSVNVKKDNNGQDKDVNITTPFGGIHVNNNADARDTGLPVYPGARVKPKDGNDGDKSANVEFSTGEYGLKVVAIEYLSDEAPSKVISYYQGELKKYGKVLQCRNSHGTNYTYNKDSNELKCESDDGGKTVELKAGTKGNQHIVSVDPEGTGSHFALVYVHVRGKDDAI